MKLLHFIRQIALLLLLHFLCLQCYCSQVLICICSIRMQPQIENFSSPKIDLCTHVNLLLKVTCLYTISSNKANTCNFTQRNSTQINTLSYTHTHIIYSHMYKTLHLVFITLKLEYIVIWIIFSLLCTLSSDKIFSWWWWRYHDQINHLHTRTCNSTLTTVL